MPARYPVKLKMGGPGGRNKLEIRSPRDDFKSRRTGKSPDRLPFTSTRRQAACGPAAVSVPWRADSEGGPPVFAAAFRRREFEIGNRMNAYLFNAWISQYQHGHYGDGCSSLILYGADSQAARRYFEHSLLQADNPESPAPTRVECLVSAPLLDQLLTEAGPEPIDWEQVCARAAKDLEAAAPDDFDHGYWVDCDQCVPPDGLASDIEKLQASLPEDIRSGLNWSPEKTRFYILSVLRPLAPPPEPPDEFEEREAVAPGAGEDSDAGAEAGSTGVPTPFPEVAQKELAVLLRARNSVVATWLWRKHAADTAFKNHAIRIDAWCGALPCPG